MPQKIRKSVSRREVLAVAAALPVLGLAGCGGDEPASTAQTEPAAPAPEAPAETAPAAEPAGEVAAEAPADSPAEPAAPDTTAEATPAAPADASQLDEADATAQALGYRHDAADVDAAKYPQRAANAVCANCALFQGGGEWGACPIFAGKLVNAEGWCSSWVAKPA
ncbi:MAG: high-potential iron-sulfur protein [Pseudomonadota bacterium]